ncbi:MAG: hypothetical protein WC346_20360 [Methanogenium sp.]|jgi:hypothetical protein
MKNSWREILSWNDSIYNHPDHQNGLKRLIEELDKKGIPHRSIVDPSGYRKSQVILIEREGIPLLYVEYFYDSAEYRLHKRGWKWISSREETSLNYLIEDIESELL